MPWADVITDQPGAYLGSQVWAKHDVTRLHTKSEVQVKCNSSMYQAMNWVEGNRGPNSVINATEDFNVINQKGYSE